jgi:hypothetical protein
VSQLAKGKAIIVLSSIIPNFRDVVSNDQVLVVHKSALHETDCLADERGAPIEFNFSIPGSSHCKKWQLIRRNRCHISRDLSTTRLHQLRIDNANH